MNASQFWEKFGISKQDDLRDCFTREELQAVETMEYLVSGLVGCGWDYSRVKALIQQNNSLKQLAA